MKKVFVEICDHLAAPGAPSFAFEPLDKYKIGVLPASEFRSHVAVTCPRLSPEKLDQITSGLTKEGPNQEVDYKAFLRRFEETRSQRYSLNKLFTAIIAEFKSGRNGLFKELQQKDTGQTGSLPSSEFFRVFGRLIRTLMQEEADTLLFFYRTGGEQEAILYKEFQSDVEQEMKATGNASLVAVRSELNAEELGNYWGRKWMVKIMQYCQERKIFAVDQLFFNIKLDNNYVTQENFKLELEKAVPDINANDLVRLTVELQDPKTGLVSLDKFSSLYGKHDLR